MKGAGFKIAVLAVRLATLYFTLKLAKDFGAEDNTKEALICLIEVLK